jgi:hypothetical protein
MQHVKMERECFNTPPSAVLADRNPPQDGLQSVGGLQWLVACGVRLYPSQAKRLLKGEAQYTVQSLTRRNLGVTEQEIDIAIYKALHPPNPHIYR